MGIFSEAARGLLRRLCGVPRSRIARPASAELMTSFAHDGPSRDPVGASHGHHAIPALLGQLAAPDPAVAGAAARAIDEIVAGCDAPTLARLDGTIRRTTEWQWPVPGAEQVVAMAHGLTGTLGVLSFNASGHARQAAVRALAELRDGRELAFLLIRLNDWVREIRQAARVAVGERIRPDYAHNFVRCLPLVYRLKLQSRDDHGAVFDSVIALLRDPASREPLREALRGGERSTRRFAFKLLVSGEDDESTAVLCEAAASADAVLRLWAARELRARLDGEELRESLDRMKRDRFMPVRREALYGFVEKLPDLAPAEIHAALLDPHASMREAARYFLRKNGTQDPSDFYRTGVDRLSGSELEASVLGLGETGRAPDAARVEPLMAHPSRRVRRAATRAVGRLDPDSYVDRLLTALQDEAPGVAKEAAVALRPRIYLVAPSRLSSIFRTDVRHHVRLKVLRLIAELQWWDATPSLIEASASDDPVIRNTAATYLDRQARNVNVLSVKPLARQLESLHEAIEAYAHSLDVRVRGELVSLLEYARRHVR